MKPNVRKTVLALASLTVAAAGCTSNAYDSAYYDPYTYYSYYPADVAYSSYYWADPYYYSYQDYGTGTGTPTGTDTGSTPDAGTVAAGPVSPSDGGTTVVGTGIGDVIRALARGEAACGDRATVTARSVANPCPTAGAETVRSGATIVFNACVLSNGGTLDGTIDVETTRTASEATCSSTTTITISHTTTVTNLAYTGPAGRRIFIPSQTATGTDTFVNGQRPASLSAHITGSLQIFEASGAATSDRSYDGDVTITPATNRTAYAINGTLTLTDADQSGTTVLTATSLTRSTSCCRPTAGTVSVVRTGTNAFSTHTWNFNGASCGSVRFDDDSVTLATCL